MSGVSGQSDALDLASCDSEPIHIPGSIQPHGILLSLHPSSLTLLQCSANLADICGEPATALTGRALQQILPSRVARQLMARLEQEQVDRDPVYLCNIDWETPVSVRQFDVLAHRSDGCLIIELEEVRPQSVVKSQQVYARVNSAIVRMRDIYDIHHIAAVAAEEVAGLAKFDRVLIYRFDPDGHGTVIGEARNDKFPTLMDHRFPASDIPAQARALYRINRVRLIPNGSYEPSELVPASNPLTGQPLDLSFSALRSVSPIHREYMRNMGTGASMSLSIMRGDQLWGLIACHNIQPMHVPFEVRSACELLSQIFSQQLNAAVHRNEGDHRLRLKSIQSELLASMTAHDPFVRGLEQLPAALLQFADAGGAAICFNGECALVGKTPAMEQIMPLIDWLISSGRHEVYATDQLPGEYPQAEAFSDVASGLLAISISKLHKSYILWFRPEVEQTVPWSGDPRLPAHRPEKSDRLHPRNSFKIWREIVRGHSLPWHHVELEAAVELRNVILGIVLRRAEEMAELSHELKRSNRELEAFSYSVSHDLRAPFRHIIGYAELLSSEEGARMSDKGRRYMHTIIESATFAGELVDNLLIFSQIGRANLELVRVDLNALITETRSDLEMEIGDRLIEWHVVSGLPIVRGDMLMLRLAVRNLLSNAVKYTRDSRPAMIDISGGRVGAEYVLSIKDNGVGFDMKYANKLFGVFQRLHRMEDFEGTGIGLANVERIMTRHRGRVWADARVNEGATFHLAFPVTMLEE